MQRQRKIALDAQTLEEYILLAINQQFVNQRKDNFTQNEVQKFNTIEINLDLKYQEHYLSSYDQ